MFPGSAATGYAGGTVGKDRLHLVSDCQLFENGGNHNQMSYDSLLVRICVPSSQDSEMPNVLYGEETFETLIQYLALYYMLMNNQCFVLTGAHTYSLREKLGDLCCFSGHKNEKFRC